MPLILQRIASGAADDLARERPFARLQKILVEYNLWRLLELPVPGIGEACDSIESHGLRWRSPGSRQKKCLLASLIHVS